MTNTYILTNVTRNFIPNKGYLTALSSELQSGITARIKVEMYGQLKFDIHTTLGDLFISHGF